MDLFLFLVFGLIVGIVARWLVPGPQSGGWLTSLLLGVLGSFVGGYVGRQLDWYDEGQLAGFLMAVAGAVVLLIVYRALVGRRTGI